MCIERARERERALLEKLAHRYTEHSRAHRQSQDCESLWQARQAALVAEYGHLMPFTGLKCTQRLLSSFWFNGYLAFFSRSLCSHFHWFFLSSLTLSLFLFSLFLFSPQFVIANYLSFPSIFLIGSYYCIYTKINITIYNNSDSYITIKH